jgi:hypothetical protein
MPLLGIDENIADKAHHAQVIQGRLSADMSHYQNVDPYVLGEMKHSLLDGDVTSYDLVRSVRTLFDK